MSVKIIGASVVFEITDSQISESKFSESTSFKVRKNGAVAVQNGQILKVGDFENLVSEFGLLDSQNVKKCADFENLDSENVKFYKGCVLMPALVNAHIHFEFSANNGAFEFGDFGVWLDSVISKRDDVLSDTTQAIKQAVRAQKMCGVGSVGAISSYGYDLEILADSGLKVVYFNEAMGSSPAALDTIFSNFKARVLDSVKFSQQHENLKPAIALHSPYSLHNVFAKKAMQLHDELNLQTPISAHFMESKHEREWLDSQSGYFKGFFENFGVQNPKPFYTADEFLSLFDGKNALFTHCLEVLDSEILQITSRKQSIVTCARSNRLLANKYFDFSRQNLPNIALGTDGKSSNNDVDLLNEMRTLLFATSCENLENLAREIILMATINGAKALDLNNGALEKGKGADLAVFEIAGIEEAKQPQVQFILQAKTAKALFINGEILDF